ncbi:ATP-binding protein [Actinomyces wuliandei]|uniref:ATP-binding protein n=1 Tax=Actinomyces wuliandei TaxID=2057743 RepID=UPI00111B1196|nr:DUF4143 domain-containing protein [Actinomyces wuliandei]
MSYLLRHLDSYLDELFPALPAIAIEGAKGVGKTETALRRVTRVLRLDEHDVAQLVAAGGKDFLERGRRSVLLDEWQHLPQVWDWVRRMVDDRSTTPVLLTGSATPRQGTTTHSGAGRIVSVLMRPMSLTERGTTPGGLGLAALLAGDCSFTAESTMTLPDYAEEVCASGFPGIRPLTSRARAVQLDSYIERVIDRDILEQGGSIRRPGSLRAWLRSYAAATSTTASYSAILDAATAGDSGKPARSTTQTYRDLLTRIWVLDPVPTWDLNPSAGSRLKTSPKHQLVDPAVSARLLGTTASALMSARPGSGELFGRLFEALATLCVRAASLTVDARVGHLRTRNGDHEIDLVVEDSHGRVVAFEVKLARDVGDRDVAHLAWLKRQLGDRLSAGVVLTAGRHAYLREDGFLVLPLALLD